MYVVVLAGGIASGKSTAARELERLGAVRIDLDRLSRDVLAPGSDTARAVVAAFGPDLVDPTTGELSRRRLAARAFATPQAAAQLEAIELPAIRARLEHQIDALRQRGDVACCVIEVPLLDRIGGMADALDEVIVVDCPVDVRRVRAVGRGMDAADFDARAANQPTDEWLRTHADTVLDNSGTAAELSKSVRRWWEARPPVAGGPA